ncbi:nuclear transport factor 2 family protein [Streptomyces sp. FH025]|uniref:nuclear transport factor 2 family protein n=1 Tax=Streptomyces sp. FH025 TaxID=2815937 RepID=UPI001A9EB9A1|nr:nuclear transport factor 2 family protein [Streptomyces sp. FH025]MBO1414205.1 nuclear transport factor 2 family protein [Streptomyces sp. FH025]
MSDITAEQIVDTYFQAWGDFDADSRKALLEGLFTENAEIIDPDWLAHNRQEIIEAVAAARVKLGDLPLRLTKVIGAHHDEVLYSWYLGPDAAAPIATGIGLLSLEHGKIRKAYNFFG